MCRALLVSTPGDAQPRGKLLESRSRLQLLSASEPASIDPLAELGLRVTNFADQQDRI
jgi:hypothetical protein